MANQSFTFLVVTLTLIGQPQGAPTSANAHPRLPLAETYELAGVSPITARDPDFREFDRQLSGNWSVVGTDGTNRGRLDINWDGRYQWTSPSGDSRDIGRLNQVRPDTNTTAGRTYWQFNGTAQGLYIAMGPAGPEVYSVASNRMIGVMKFLYGN